MSRRRATVVSVIAVLSLVTTLLVAAAPSRTKSKASSPSSTILDLQAQIKATAAKVIPAVVNIASTVVVRDQFFTDEGLPFGLMPEGPPRRQYGQGSGVIVTSDGYIVTNNHVVAEANTVEVLLADRRQFKGKVVAADPKTDVAVVKIEASGLPTVPWGDSAHLGVGDFVLAIGNPLGLNQTVTFGIVSAVGRADVGVADYEDFIQMDAPINPGNSGGALVNVKGELVGINTAIASMTGGSVGVGFAIPSNMARIAMQGLIKKGRVVRGFLGASTQDVTPLLGKVFRLPDVKGAIITEIMSKGSAEAAGLRRGDVVVRLGGTEIMDAGRLRNLIATQPIGSRHTIEFVRDGKLEQTELVIQEAPRERARKASVEPKPTPVHPLGGVLVDELTPSIARQLGISGDAGVVVAGVEEGSLAETAGLASGDVILEVNRQPVNTLASYQRLVDSLKATDIVLLLVSRQGAQLYVPLAEE